MRGKNPEEDNSDSEIYILSSIEETALHLSIYDTFPKYDIVSNNADIQNHPFNIRFETMTSIKDRKKAK